MFVELGSYGDKRMRVFVPIRATCRGKVEAMQAIATVIPCPSVLVDKSSPYGSFLENRVPKNGWFAQEILIEMNDLRVPPLSGNLHMSQPARAMKFS